MTFPWSPKKDNDCYLDPRILNGLTDVLVGLQDIPDEERQEVFDQFLNKEYELVVISLNCFTIGFNEPEKIQPIKDLASIIGMKYIDTSKYFLR